MPTHGEYTCCIKSILSPETVVADIFVGLNIVAYDQLLNLQCVRATPDFELNERTKEWMEEDMVNKYVSMHPFWKSRTMWTQGDNGGYLCEIYYKNISWNERINRYQEDSRDYEPKLHSMWHKRDFSY